MGTFWTPVQVLPRTVRYLTDYDQCSGQSSTMAVHILTTPSFRATSLDPTKRSTSLFQCSMNSRRIFTPNVWSYAWCQNTQQTGQPPSNYSIGSFYPAHGHRQTFGHAAPYTFPGAWTAPHPTGPSPFVPPSLPTPPSVAPVPTIVFALSTNTCPAPRNDDPAIRADNIFTLCSTHSWWHISTGINGSCSTDFSNSAT